MKKYVFVLTSFFFVVCSNAQSVAGVRPTSFGISFIFYDYETPGRIRASNIKQVLKDGAWADLNEMSPGLALTYFKGLHPKIDFAASFTGSFVDNALPHKTIADNAFLMEADATLQFNMLSSKYMFTPYLLAGVGASKFKSYYGAFMPFGGGFKLNFFDEAAFFINAKYHVPVTSETVNGHFIYGLGIAGVIGKH